MQWIGVSPAHTCSRAQLVWTTIGRPSTAHADPHLDGRLQPSRLLRRRRVAPAVARAATCGITCEDPHDYQPYKPEKLHGSPHKTLKLLATKETEAPNQTLTRGLQLVPLRLERLDGGGARAQLLVQLAALLLVHIPQQPLALLCGGMWGVRGSATCCRNHLAAQLLLRGDGLQLQTSNITTKRMR
jgi:hypothetical protein